MTQISISALSRHLFSELDEGDYRILKALAKHGALNEAEIGELTSRNFALSFDRWGVKRRMKGSINFVGLVPNDFVYALKINKKETKYGLTLKGILAVLAKTDFGQIKAVQEYRKSLEKINKNPTLLKLALDYIVAEIKLILHHNYINGFGWTRLKILREYWHEFKQYDDKIIQKFFTNIQSSDYLIDLDYNITKEDYMKKYFYLDSRTYMLDYRSSQFDFDNSSPYNDYEFRMHVDRWYLVIDSYKEKGFTKFEYQRNDLLQYFDSELWYQERKALRKNGYKLYQKMKDEIDRS